MSCRLVDPPEGGEAINEAANMGCDGSATWAPPAPQALPATPDSHTVAASCRTPCARRFSKNGSGNGSGSGSVDSSCAGGSPCCSRGTTMTTTTAAAAEKTLEDSPANATTLCAGVDRTAHGYPETMGYRAGDAFRVDSSSACEASNDPESGGGEAFASAPPPRLTTASSASGAAGVLPEATSAFPTSPLACGGSRRRNDSGVHVPRVVGEGEGIAKLRRGGSLSMAAPGTALGDYPLSMTNVTDVTQIFASISAPVRLTAGPDQSVGPDESGRDPLPSTSTSGSLLPPNTHRLRGPSQPFTAATTFQALSAPGHCDYRSGGHPARSDSSFADDSVVDRVSDGSGKNSSRSSSRGSSEGAPQQGSPNRNPQCSGRETQVKGESPPLSHLLSSCSNGPVSPSCVPMPSFERTGSGASPTESPSTTADDDDNHTSNQSNSSDGSDGKGEQHLPAIEQRLQQQMQSSFGIIVDARTSTAAQAPARTEEHQRQRPASSASAATTDELRRSPLPSGAAAAGLNHTFSASSTQTTRAVATARDTRVAFNYRANTTTSGDDIAALASSATVSGANMATIASASWRGLDCGSNRYAAISTRRHPSRKKQSLATSTASGRGDGERPSAVFSSTVNSPSLSVTVGSTRLDASLRSSSCSSQAPLPFNSNSFASTGVTSSTDANAAGSAPVRRQTSAARPTDTRASPPLPSLFSSPTNERRLPHVRTAAAADGCRDGPFVRDASPFSHRSGRGAGAGLHPGGGAAAAESGTSPLNAIPFRSFHSAFSGLEGRSLASSVVYHQQQQLLAYESGQGPAGAGEEGLSQEQLAPLSGSASFCRSFVSTTSRQIAQWASGALHRIRNGGSPAVDSLADGSPESPRELAAAAEEDGRSLSLGGCPPFHRRGSLMAAAAAEGLFIPGRERERRAQLVSAQYGASPNYGNDHEKDSAARGSHRQQLEAKRGLGEAGWDRDETADGPIRSGRSLSKGSNADSSGNDAYGMLRASRGGGQHDHDECGSCSATTPAAAAGVGDGGARRADGVSPASSRNLPLSSPFLGGSVNSILTSNTVSRGKANHIPLGSHGRTHYYGGRSNQLADLLSHELYSLFRTPPSIDYNMVGECFALYTHIREACGKGIPWEALVMLMLPGDVIALSPMHRSLHLITFDEFVELVEIASVRHARAHFQ